jgi:hypothetical protein
MHMVTRCHPPTHPPIRSHSSHYPDAPAPPPAAAAPTQKLVLIQYAQLLLLVESIHRHHPGVNALCEGILESCWEAGVARHALHNCKQAITLEHLQHGRWHSSVRGCMCTLGQPSHMSSHVQATPTWVSKLPGKHGNPPDAAPQQPATPPTAW